MSSFYLYVVLRTEPSASHMLSKPSTTEVQLGPSSGFLKVSWQSSGWFLFCFILGTVGFSSALTYLPGCLFSWAFLELFSLVFLVFSCPWSLSLPFLLDAAFLGLLLECLAVCTWALLLSAFLLMHTLGFWLPFGLRSSIRTLLGFMFVVPHWRTRTLYDT